MDSILHDGASAASTEAADAPASDSHSLAADLRAPTISRAYQCQCGRPVFLGNSQCLACRTPLGYVTERLGVVPLAPATHDNAEPETFTVFGDIGGKAWRRCNNFLTAAGCNWMVPAPRDGDDASFTTEGLAPGFCLSCSATRTIPDLSIETNGNLWRKLEQAKRRLLSQLLALGLPVVTRHADPVHGLAFDFLGNMPGGPHVLTGHEEGVITLNAEEAEDAVRERIRAEMREPYRTLVGHFRHEIGHYYWDLLVFPTPWIDDYRALFGDERADYATALRTHYENGPPADWANRFVTSYASSHPWEDWAETWAHYLHMADTADTAMSFGVDAQNVELASDLFEPSDLWQPEHPGAMKFLDFLNGWVRLTNVLNELSRSMGQPDYYPFVLPRAAVGKLQFIHQVITEQRQRSQTGATQAEGTSTDVALDASASSVPPAPEAAPAPPIETVGMTQSQTQTQAQQPFFQTGLQQNQGMFDHSVGNVQSH
ncbi:zinc-binding metallopeptidase family protein [Variovorax arabinosiphilus]|uniref:zinc-binding metallopeptidase family protein n=1 Tax=Variovorax arabinosiphilus TaxID=3053498 RepID=UPI002576684E|nr:MULTISPECIES: putative zinc-binding metallopeptidase [unclassified Variovorax]MDM0122023.1 putative zinc-binding metallopeptidase [Variovorax sp. J2L1-78]MDM0131447.1 putative zinc-binding metallopeptidase [Variovorax sp. J2L1-63]MDM0234786.1 putative zinc-binding metallopeptidase [Variovorax sp. J2R1-6]